MMTMFKLLVASVLLLVGNLADAAPVAISSHGGVVIHLYDERCKMVTPGKPKLLHRARMTEKGITTEGCYAVYPDSRFVTAYFRDKSNLHTMIMRPVRSYVCFEKACPMLSSATRTVI